MRLSNLIRSVEFRFKRVALPYGCLVLSFLLLWPTFNWQDPAAASEGSMATLVAAQTSDKRFGLTVTGQPPPAALDANLALLGSQRNWYSFDEIGASAQANRQRAHVLKTGVSYALKDGAPSVTYVQNLVRSLPPGSYWLIGNEPNVPGQDEASPAQYASQYQALKNTIRQVDPSAKMVGPNVLNWNYTCDGCVGYAQADGWVSQMMQAYRQQTGQEIDFDVWGIHTYGLNWNHLPLANYQQDISQVIALRNALNGLPGQAGKPIWISEFGVIWGYSGLTFYEDGPGNFKIAPAGNFEQQALLNYVGGYADWLLANAENYKVERWFLYTSFGLPEPYTNTFTGISLLNGQTANSQLTVFGELYRAKSLTAGLDTPTGLAATVLSPTALKLDWTDGVTGEQGFVLERKTGASGIWSPLVVLGPNTNTYQDNNLVSAATYYYRIQAFNTRVNSDYSNEISQVMPLVTPTTLQATLVGQNQVRLSWLDNSSNEQGFQIERKTGATGNWTPLATAAANQTSLLSEASLAEFTLYFYRIRAYKDGLTSAYSNEASLLTPLVPPSNLSATLSAPNQIKLGWADNSGREESYRVEWRSGLAGAWTLLATLPAQSTQYFHNGLTAGTLYFYRVQAYHSNPLSYSTFSNNVGLTTPGPDNLTVRLDTDNGLADTPGTFSYALTQPGPNPRTITFALPPGVNTVTLTRLPAIIPTGIIIGGSCGPDGPVIALDARNALNSSSGWQLEKGVSLFGVRLSGAPFQAKQSSMLAYCFAVES